MTRLRDSVLHVVLVLGPTVGTLALPDVLAAQGTGTITGTLQARETGRPLAGAQVAIPDLARGTLTDERGRFLMTSVPVGSHTVEVRYIGYATVSEQVDVQADQTSTLDLQMATAAVNLEELVVTGTGVVTERKRLGATLNTISSEEISAGPVTSVSDALRGRVPGLVAMPSGEVGAASPIRIRGTVSLSQRNDPLIYVDGVRMDNSMTQLGMVSTQVLDQLNPQDIERVEVLSGAAAATLYGTEASSGVIQIFTKGGREGAPQFNFSIDQGFTKIPLNRIPDNVVYDAETDRLYRNSPGDDFIRVGHRQDYNLSVSGGTPDVQYFASGRFMDATGSLPNNGKDNWSLRSKLNFDHGERLNTEISANFIRDQLQAPYPTWGLIGEFILADPRRVDESRPYGEMFYTVDGALAYENIQTTNNIAVSGRADFSWTDEIISSATVGYNEISIESHRFSPYGASNRDPTGVRVLNERDRSLVTLDVKTSWETNFTDDLASSFVLGAQYFRENTQTHELGAQDFAGPGLGTIRGASSVFTVDEFKEEVVNAGVFAQEQIGLWDRLFLTGGVRVDGNSAFGDDFGLQVYPKAGASYVLSDESFWDFEHWDLFRIRLGYGSSGLQPNAFAAQRMWQAVAVIGNQPAVIPSNLGNSDLKPEISTEREIGAELGFFDGRLGLELTYFNQTTSDAIVPKAFPPSGGFLNQQLVNLAEVTSQGIEVSADWRILESQDFSWSVGASISTLDQEVTDLGDVAPFRVAGGNRFNTVAEGYMPGAVIGPTLDPNDPYHLSVPIEEFTDLTSQLFPQTLKNSAGQDSLVHLTNPIPTFTGSFSTTISPHPRLQLRALLVAGAGMGIYNETGEIRVQSYIEEEVSKAQMELADPSTSTERRREIADWYATKHWSVLDNWVQDADYLRLQEVSVTYAVPERFYEGYGLNNLSLSVSGSNLYLWTKYPGIIDPGTTDNPAQRNTPLVQNVDYFNTPIPPSVQFGVRTGW